MTITKTVVKTFYNIKVPASEALEIAMKASNDVTNIEKAFGWVTEDTTLKAFREVFDRYNGLSGKEASYLARQLGFDGIEWCGMPKDGQWLMTVYNDGDRLGGTMTE